MSAPGILDRLAALTDTECDFIGAIAGYADGFALREAAREVARPSFAGIPIHVDASLKGDEAYLVDNVTGQRFRLAPVEGQANG